MNTVVRGPLAGNSSLWRSRTGSEPDGPVLTSQSKLIRDIESRIDLIAKSQASVLITGESGTGKEVVARLIHAKSDKSERPFVAINCAALPRDVVDNELFGHEKEAYTGAVSRKEGCFELAHRGTLFLDEIAEMHPQSQAKLLRAIETKSFRRLGGKGEVDIDVRIIAATNKDLTAAVKSGELREDLYYRLNVVEISMPPLRKRKEDIPLLLDHFLDLFAEKYSKPRKQFSGESMEVLISSEWPGNVRELKNLVESMTLICPEDLIEPAHLPERFSKLKITNGCIDIPLGIPMREVEQILIVQTLASVGNNKSRAAKILGLSRKALYNKLEQYGLP